MNKIDLINKLPILFSSLGIDTIETELITESLTHRSFINEHRDLKHNERLEFLGDAVLELITTQFLFNKYPEKNEGFLTSLRSALVKTTNLASESTRLKIGSFILMSSGEESTGGREREYILANTIEAIIGAIYISKGYSYVYEFVVKNICYKVETILSEQSHIDAKSRLQEIAQEEFKITPSYTMVDSFGSDHDKTFVMAVIIGTKSFGEATGKSKQEAEQNAAEVALKKWDDIKKSFLVKD